MHRVGVLLRLPEVGTPTAGAPRWAAAGLAALLAAGLLVALDPSPARGADLPAAPLIEIDPGCTDGVFEGSFDMPFTVRLRNFTPNAAVTVFFGFGDQPEVENVVVGPYGSVDAQLTFTLGTTRPVPLRALETNNPAINASTTLRAPCEPALQLTPKCDAPADPLAPRALSIGVLGTDWRYLTEVRLMQRVDGTERQISATASGVPTAEQPTFNVVLNAANPGSDDVTQPLMALPSGDYFVRATRRATEAIPEVVVDIDFAVPCPQVSLNPNCGEPGGPLDIYDLAVSGSGWRPFLQAQVIFDAGGGPQVFLLDVGGTGQLLVGDVEEARIKPWRRPESPGRYTVTVRQGRAPDSVMREASTEFIVPCPPQADVVITPVCGPPQLLGDDPRTTTLRVVGSNLPAGLLTITVQPAAGGTPHIQQYGVAGNLDESFELPRRPLGSYQVDATVIDAAGAILFVKPPGTFTVPCEQPNVRLRFRCDPPETNLPDLADVVLEARGFYPDAPLELAVGGTTETVRTDANGTFSRRTPASSLPNGPIESRAMQRDINGAVAVVATRTLILPCGTRVPTLVISPLAGSPGQVVLVSGFNIRPNVGLSLRWSRGIGSGRTIDVTTDEDGIFERQVLLFHNDFTGVRVLTVESSDDPLAVGISVTFVVAPGRGTPPGFSESAPGFPPLIFRR
ncbi:MAG: hypothetical protein ACR2H0_03500 [Candidatus Limnocylindrales bacterium]